VGSRVRAAVAPLYLLLCLTLGGSAQGIWANLVLQLLGLAVLASAALARPIEPWPKAQTSLFACALAAVALIGLQLVPLPPAIWQHLGGRETVADGFDVLGLQQPWLPVSLTPYDSIAMLPIIVPPLALLAAMWRLGSRPLWLILALVAGTVGGILLGALQISSADPTTSPWYLYSRTNYGVATGFFANANHMATLLVITLPFLAALLAAARRDGGNVQRYSAAFALVAGAALVIAVGLAINGSLAGYGLAIPVVAASVMILFPRRTSMGRWIAIGVAVLAVAVAGAISLSPVGGSGRAQASSSVLTRQEIMSTTARAAGDFLPLGSGLGSFRRVYALYEDHQRPDLTAVVNHAHNDYLELALETGLPGILILIAFLIWWGRAAWRAWVSPEQLPYAKAAAVASAAILVHSLVDFPLRTAAISACFAMCLGVLAASRPKPERDRSDLRPARHIVIS
jgi:O-antigen ligase